MEDVSKPEGPILRATRESVASASHLTKADQGMVQTLYGLAENMDFIVASGGESKSGKFDNVTPSMYLKCCDALGLTPSARARLDLGSDSNVGGKLAKLRAVKTA